MPSPVRIVAAVAALIPLLAGCTIGGGASSPTSAPTSQSTDQATRAGSASPGSVESSSAAQAGVDLTNLSAPIASATIPAAVKGDPDAKMTVSLYSLRRTGKVLTATFSFKVTSTDTTADSLFGYLNDSVWWPYLVNTQDLKRHDVLVGGGARAKTDDLARFAPGQTFYAYAMFAAPPEGVTTMDVQLIGSAPTATKVPIT